MERAGSEAGEAVAGGEDEVVDAGMLVTDGGALVAFTEDGLMVRAWAPGEWRTALAWTAVLTYCARPGARCS